MTPDEKLDKLLTSVAKIEEKQDHFCDTVAGHHRTLYGGDGTGGLVSRVSKTEHDVRLYNGGLALVLSGAWAAIVKLLTGGNQ